MVCDPCSVNLHGRCRGGNWCDCQHAPPGTFLPAPYAPRPAPAPPPTGEIPALPDVPAPPPAELP